jgi:DNA mismatch repair ATPase MutS
MVERSESIATNAQSDVVMGIEKKLGTGQAGSFKSILFGNNIPHENGEIPSYFRDLNLDQIFTSMLKGREEYDLQPYFSMPLHSNEDIIFRHEVLRDLEKTEVLEAIEEFAQSMKEMRKHLVTSDKLRNEYQKAGWFLDGIKIYIQAVTRLHHRLVKAPIESHGLREFTCYLGSYLKMENFTQLESESRELTELLSRVDYCVRIYGTTVMVFRYNGEEDYSKEVERTFHRFNQGSVNNYIKTFYDPEEMNHIETNILNRVAKLFPDVFRTLVQYHNSHKDYLDQTIALFDREIQFYLAYLEFIADMRSTGLEFSYPDMTCSKDIHAEESFDLALAHKLVQEGTPVICNGFFLKDQERVFVVTGPNQGGKTTFARMFGQLHYLASLGYLVPGRCARLFLYDHIFTHFEKGEQYESLRGKLQDELIRMHEILQKATSNSIVIINEGFASTTLEDSRNIGREVLIKIIQRDTICVYVTFVDELSTISEATVSLVATIDQNDPALRTFRFERRPSDGRAYAIALANKYGLTYSAIKERIEQ